MRLRGSLMLLGLLLSGCQLVFGLGDFSEGNPSNGGANQGGAGAGGDAGSGGGTTTTTTGIGGGTTCECLDPIWKPVNLVAQGDPSVDVLPTTCPTGDVLNLFDGVPTVACGGCGCSATCTKPALNCFTDANCSAGQNTVNPSGNCYNIGSKFQSFSLSAAPTVATCDSSGGAAKAAYAFAEFFSFCAEPSCIACEPPSAGQACVAAPGILPQCPAGLDEQQVLYASGEASCPACGCDASCKTPYEVYYFAQACLGGGTGIPSTGCTSSSDKQLVTNDLGEADCTTGPSGDHPGTFTTASPFTVCCRSALTPPG